jgi:hypothetical protein
LGLLVGIVAYDAVVAPTPLAYADAQRYCRSLGRRLPVIETQVQQEQLDAKCAEDGHAHDCTWLALRCPAEDLAACTDRHSWFLMNADGQKTSALANIFVRHVDGVEYRGGFASSNFAAISAGGYCMATSTAVSGGNFVQWQTRSCGQARRTVCEKPAGGLSQGARLTLPGTFNKVTAMVADESFLFATTYTGQLIKVNQLNLDDFGVLNFGTTDQTAEYSDLGAIAVDATHAFVAAKHHVSSTQTENVVLKIDKGQMTMESTSRFVIEHADNLAFSILEKDDFVYVGVYTFPGRVLKVNKASMELSARCILSQDSNDVRAMSFDHTNPGILFAYTNTIPGRVAKVNLATMEEVTHIELEAGQNSLLSGYDQDGTHVVVGTATSPAQIVQLRKSDLATTAAVTLAHNQDMAISIATDAVFTYAGLYTSPARVVRLRNSDLGEVQAFEIAGSDKITALVIPDASSGAGDKVYIGTDTSPGQIVEFVGALHASDCAISHWSHWSECDKTCGGGVQSRSRSVVHPATNGGMDCPADLMQNRVCNADVICPRECKDGMVWTTEAKLPRPTCSMRTPTVVADSVNMCACPTDKPYWHNHGMCVTTEVCNAHVHSSICTHLQCAYVAGKVQVSPIAGATMVAQPYHCQHRPGRSGGCVCMCDTGASSAAPTPAPAACYLDETEYGSEHQIGGLTMLVGSATLCQAQCVSAPDCRKWSYKRDPGECFLFGELAQADPVTAHGFTSGPKVCPIDARVASEFAVSA